MMGAKGDEGLRGFKGAFGPPGLQVRNHFLLLQKTNHRLLLKVKFSEYVFGSNNWEIQNLHFIKVNSMNFMMKLRTSNEPRYFLISTK